MSKNLGRSASRRIGYHIKRTTKSLPLMLKAQPTSTPTPSEPFEEVIHQYTDTACTTQKQTNLTKPLLQDIAVFNEHDLTKLEG